MAGRPPHWAGAAARPAVDAVGKAARVDYLAPDLAMPNLAAESRSTCGVATAVGGGQLHCLILVAW